MKYKIKILFEKMLFKIAWLLPKKLVYFCAIRLMSNATVGKYSNQEVPELTVIDALKRWEF